MIELVIRNLLNRKARTFLTVLGVILGVGIIVALVSVANGLENEISNIIQQENRITVMKAGVLDPILGTIPAEYEKKVESMEGVKIAGPMVIKIVDAVDGELTRKGITEMTGLPFTLAGVNPQDEAESSSKIPRSLVEGRFLRHDDKYSVVIGKPIAERYNKKLGDTINLDGTDFKIVGIFSTGSELSDSYALAPIDIVRKVAKVPKEEVNLIWVEVKDPAKMEVISDIIEEKLEGVMTKTPKEILQDLFEMLFIIKSSAWIITGISAVIGGIGIVNTMLMSVMERRREIGIYKAVGWTDREVILLFILESALLGASGGIIGILLGSATVLAGAAVRNVPYLISPDLILEAFCFALLLGVVGGIYPAWRTTKIYPAEALRYE